MPPVHDVAEENLRLRREKKAEYMRKRRAGSSQEEKDARKEKDRVRKRKVCKGKAQDFHPTSGTPLTAPGSAVGPPPLADDPAQEARRMEKEGRAEHDRKRRARPSAQQTSADPLEDENMRPRKVSRTQADGDFAAGVQAAIGFNRRQAMERKRSNDRIRARERRSKRTADVNEAEMQADASRKSSVRAAEDDAQRAARLQAHAEAERAARAARDDADRAARYTLCPPRE